MVERWYVWKTQPCRQKEQQGKARQEQGRPLVQLGTPKVCAEEHRRRRSGEGTLGLQGLAKDFRFLPGADEVP